jgi:PST family polysaccharide transporter
MAAATMAAALALVFAGDQIARYAGLAGEQLRLARWLAVPLALSAAYVFLTSMLNALGDIAALARLQLVAPLVVAVLAYPVARGVAGGSEGFLVVLLAASSCAAMWAAAGALVRHKTQLRAWLNAAPARWWSAAAARRFLGVSAALAVSGLIASWALVDVRARILRMEGLAAAGQFDAAWAISMNQATLVLASLQTYYLPALARARRPGAGPGETAEHITRVLTLATCGAAVLIAALIALRPWVVATLYSDAFADASRYLRWTLMGDYLKVTSWILSIPLVAAGDMRTFLAADLSAYGAFVAGSALVALVRPATDAAAIAFVLMYAVHLAFCATCLWRRGIYRPDARTLGAWTAGLALIGAASAAFWNS